MKVFLAVFLVNLVVFVGCTPVKDSMETNYHTYQELDLSLVPDGIFLGEHYMNDIDYQVEVSVESQKIKCIKIIHGVQKEFRKKCALCKINELIQDIVEEQSLGNLDAVSGATQNSNGIIDAIKDAVSPPYDLIVEGAEPCD